MTRLNLFILLTCAAIGLAGYLAKGEPGLGDLPMDKRQAALTEKIRTDPGSLTAAEALSRLEATAVEQPDAPEPHFFIGEMLRQQNRPADAARAYQSALRRDANYVPALTALANTLVELGDGAVSPDARRLFLRAYELDPVGQVRAGMWAAMGAAQAGDDATAQAEMAALLEKLPEDHPMRQRISAMAAATADQDTAPPN